MSDRNLRQEIMAARGKLEEEIATSINTFYRETGFVVNEMDISHRQYSERGAVVSETELLFKVDATVTLIK